jgi:general L-amino acid transport system permease protein
MRYVATARIAPAPPPRADVGWHARVRDLYFGSVASGVVTLLLATACASLGWRLFTWGVRDAVFAVGPAGAQACRAPGVGACWAVVGEKLRLILFGLYPYAEQWRAAVVMVVLVLMYLLSTRPRLWNWRLAVAWVAALAGCALLMWGGMLGLPYVPDDRWGGLPVTLILATLGLAAAFPIAIALALLRHARRRGVGNALAVAWIEVARAVPLLAVLFLASLMIPLFLPQGLEVSKLLRVFVAFALFAAAYLAEVIRGGLQAIPLGQREAAEALGLTPYVITMRVVLPQALVIVLPALVNVFIAFFKATSIVVVVGIFDLMTAAKHASADSLWQGFGTEVYLFAAAIYFVFCFSLSRYSERLHHGLGAGRLR